MLKRLLLLVPLALASAGAPAAQAPSSSAVTALVGATLVDGTGSGLMAPISSAATNSRARPCGASPRMASPAAPSPPRLKTEVTPYTPDDARAEVDALAAKKVDWIKAGLTPMQAIVAATGDAARCMRQAGQIGTLVRGAHADYAVYGASPAENIRNTRTLERVAVGGRPIALR